MGKVWRDLPPSGGTKGRQNEELIEASGTAHLVKGIRDIDLSEAKWLVLLQEKVVPSACRRQLAIGRCDEFLVDLPRVENQAQLVCLGNEENAKGGRPRLPEPHEVALDQVEHKLCILLAAAN